MHAGLIHVLASFNLFNLSDDIGVNILKAEILKDLIV